MIKKLLIVWFAFFNILAIYSQGMVDPVDWDFYHEKVDENTVNLVFEARIDDGWYIYDIEPHGDINSTTFEFIPSKGYEKIGKVVASGKYKEKHDEYLDADYRVYPGKAIFKQKVKLTKEGKVQLEGKVTYFACTDKMCTPPLEDTFTFNLTGTNTGEIKKDGKEAGKPLGEKEIKEETIISPGALKQEKDSTDSVVVEKQVPTDHQASNEIDEDAKDKSSGSESIWWIIWTSFLGGLGAILTPCVYPMIPLTVSFFMQGKRSKAASVSRGAFFGFSIILIYTLVGVIAAFFGSQFTKTLSEHWIPNMIFFLFFIFFALSFFGLFEITLPSGLANKLDRQADKGGILGPFFIALTTVIVSFSCTGPIVGSLLFEAVSGDFLQPVAGMFAFGLAFSLPFTIFAISPGIMKGLPKSGGWLNSVKVVLAFLILAFGLKFLV
ncbi:MAG: cytochrome c biogenesis protein CcdA, partial [Bacteroidota bacterium]